MYTLNSLIIMIICLTAVYSTVAHSNASLPNRPRSTRTILDEMKSDKGLCIFPSDELYNLDLLTMCNVPLQSNQKSISEYLTLNFVPLLCMSLYDVSLRLCNLTTSHPELKIKIPQTVKNFKEWQMDIEKSEEYSSIGKFCSTTAVHNGSLLDRSGSSVTADWINYFNTNLRDENVCKRVCQVSGLSNPDGVHPVCSFIIWSNNLYSATAEPSVKNHISKKVDEGNEGRPVGIQSLEADDIGDTGGQIGKGLQIIPNGNLSKLSATHHNIDEPPSKDKKPAEETSVQINNLKLKNKNDRTMAAIPKNITYYDPIAGIEKKQDEILSHEQAQPGGESETGKEAVFQSKEIQKPSTLNGAQSSDSITTLPQSDKTEHEPNVPDPKENDSVGNVEQAENPLTDEKSALPEDEEFIHNNEEPLKINEDENQDDNDYQAPPPKENDPPKLQNEEQSTDKDEYIVKDGFINAEDSHFFTNFVSLAVLCIIAYLVFHNKKKLLALVVEGKRRGPARRRPNTASYSKLDCNLEEAMVSNTTASVTHVLY